MNADLNEVKVSDTLIYITTWDRTLCVRNIIICELPYLMQNILNKNAFFNLLYFAFFRDGNFAISPSVSSYTKSIPLSKSAPIRHNLCRSD